MKKIISLFLFIHCAIGPSQIQNGQLTGSEKHTLSFAYIEKDCQRLNNGVPFVKVDSSRLAQALILRSLLKFDDESRKEKDCSLNHHVEMFFVKENLLYFSQSSPFYGTDCLLYDIKNEQLKKPRECITLPLSPVFKIQPLGENLYFVSGSTEGIPESLVIEWRPDTKTKIVLEYITSLQSISYQDGFYEILSSCNPLNGEVPEQAWPRGSCQKSEISKCSLCAATNGKVFKWRWRPNQNPVLRTLHIMN